jgi:hypothetical protein
MEYAKLIGATLLFITGYYYLNIFLFITLTFAISFFYFVGEFRHKFAYFPLYVMTTVQGRNFKIATNYQEIKQALKFKDKGEVIEELLASPAWSPILSVESVNGEVWEELRRNFFIFVEHLPSKEKLGEISHEESKELLTNNLVVDARQISISTLKIFLKWIFCENHIEILKSRKNIINNPVNSGNSDYSHEKYNKTENSKNLEKKYDFISNFITNEFLENFYESSLEYRKEIAVKGKGNQFKKHEAINLIVNILQKSKFNKLFDWNKPECYSVIMQPFIISPMINMSDIAVSLKNFQIDLNSHKTSLEYIESCLFKSHPFPILERYDASTNTQIFIDMRKLTEMKDIEGTAINFGLGVRSCLGRVYARQFLNYYFSTDMINSSLFDPKKNHLYSGRDNDNTNLKEGIYQIIIVIKVVIKEVYKRMRRVK